MSNTNIGASQDSGWNIGASQVDPAVVVVAVVAQLETPYRVLLGVGM